MPSPFDDCDYDDDDTLLEDEAAMSERLAEYERLTASVDDDGPLCLPYQQRF